MRKSGIILPVFSIPSDYGIGTLGKEAYKFVDFLKNSGQNFWQVLPVGPTSYGDSPYQSFSTFAGNPYFIDLDLLLNEGLLTFSDIEKFSFGNDIESIDYAVMYENRYKVLKIAYENRHAEIDEKIREFREKNKEWIEDYAIFMALKDYNKGQAWSEWEEGIKFRRGEEIEKYKNLLGEEIYFYIFLQYFFYKQWDMLKRYANLNGIEIIGDIPIYVAFDSADVWANPNLYSLDENLNPKEVAGCPPDAFSETGQLWGNPIYNWEAMEKENYSWWISRIREATKMFDVIRIDHFRGFESYWSIPFEDETAINGQWKKGPGKSLFDKVSQELGEVNVIAEDLGYITKEVRDLLNGCGYAGMKVLQFAFDPQGDSEYLPHNHIKNSVVYTGTHDNDTVKGWYESLTEEERVFCNEYSGMESSEDNWKFIELALGSVSDTAILQVQDILNVGSEGRINIPSTLGENWKWRIKKDSLTKSIEKKLRSVTRTYRRGEFNMEEKIDNNSDLDKRIEMELLKIYGKEASEVTVNEMHNVVSKIVMDKIAKRWTKSNKNFNEERHAYYLSAEFLVGRAIQNNLICMGIFDEVREALGKLSFDINKFDEIEDMALGNGGLGRLAACFLDSAASCDIPLNGYGIRYKYGLFKQKFEDGFQVEEADNWTRYGDNWSIRKFEDKIKVKFSDLEVIAVPYDMPIIGYKTENIGTLRLWQSEAVEDFNFEDFNNSKYNKAVLEKTKAENISAVLYPNDNTQKGKVLRYRQQYFFVSASLQDVIRTYKKKYGKDFSKFASLNIMQLNDTHPVIAIPEFIRLMKLEGISFNEAFNMAREIFNYTNHTVMAEALEKWDVKLIRIYTPEVMKVIYEIDKKLVKEVLELGVKKEELSNYKIVCDRKVHMARMATFIGKYVNGVAEIHTEILKKDTLSEWYKLYNEKFQNKTNGVTQRRWLASCNKELTELLTRLSKGDSFIKNLEELRSLNGLEDNEEVLNEYIAIKSEKKRQLIDYIEKNEGIKLSEDFIFDIQIKRLHEYKRQFMNALSILDLYYRIKDGEVKDFYKTAFIFGAKAAPGYRRAKAIIKLINEIANLINNDKDMEDKIKVVFVQNYNVSYAEKLIPAANVSEQISTAGTEASGTGNMKFMLNGAVTFGTLDGANIEIVREAGLENNYIFGAKEEEILEIKDRYNPKEIYENNPHIKRVLDSVIDGTLNDGMEDEEGVIEGSFKELYNSLLKGTSWHKPDHYFILNDFDRYFEARIKLNNDYKNKEEFFKKCFRNTVNAGFFSSDRTIRDYAKNIWKI
ncbi:MAG: 4-alpha-glucanotransferase [Clostridium sp.]|uniref:4-alpha-glucanotransferase n=1 Tax=Clostridium sp. TaxID=1506 RepID=UPI003EE66100